MYRTTSIDLDEKRRLVSESRRRPSTNAGARLEYDRVSALPEVALSGATTAVAASCAACVTGTQSLKKESQTPTSGQEAIAGTSDQIKAKRHISYRRIDYMAENAQKRWTKMDICK